MSYCRQCGAQLADAAAFCTSCGARTEDAPAAAPVSPPVLPKAESVQQPSAGQKSSSSGLGTVLAWLAVACLVLVGIGVAGVVYIGHRVEKKVKDFARTQDTQNPTQTTPAQPGSGDAKSGDPKNAQDNDDVSKALQGIGGILDRTGFGDPPPNPYADMPVAKSAEIYKNLCASADTAKDLPVPTNAELGPSGIPMREGLTVIHAWGRKPGDSESMHRVAKVTDKFVEVLDSGAYFATPDDVKGTAGSDMRDVCSEDVQTADGIRTGFSDDGPRTSPGTTTSNLSQALFNDLKTKGHADFRYLEWMKVSDMEQGEGYLHWDGGVLTRVEPGDVAIPVIVNGTPTTLSAIHAAGTLVVEDKKAHEMSKSPSDKPTPTEIFVLDAPKNLLILIYKMDINNFRVQTTEIRSPVEKPVKKIEQDLLKNKRAVVYGIYFDFDKDTIKPESDPVLKEIAQVMNDNPDWKLSVEGHTDNIGADAHNLDLSRRRTASVKKALVERYLIAPDRLTTSGSGAAGAIDTNDTLEGRARNRRVELSRE